MLIYSLLISLHFLFSQPEKGNTIYIAKNDWHVGIFLEINNRSSEKISALEFFSKFKLIDIGWGDADFYQSDVELDLVLATKAIIIPTSSVIRLQGYNMTIDEILDWRDYTFKLLLDDSQFDKLCEFINQSFSRDSENQIIKTSEKFNGVIQYFSSVHKYHLFNTCNTWVAEALEYSGLDINASKVITADHLFAELIKAGILLKK